MKTLFLDIETAPNLGHVWAKYEQNVLAYERERYMLCFSYKWLGEEETHVVSQIDFPTAFKKDKYDDSRVVKAVWKLLDEADVVIGHNIRAFDLKMINAFFLINELGPPSPYQTVDTLVAARSSFKFNSNSLKDLCNTLGLPAKVDAGGFSTWLGCMDGDPDAWAHMIHYARVDTELLEPLYNRLLPYIKQHPTMNWHDEDACPKCAAVNTLQRRGQRRTKVSVFQTYYCTSCRGYSSARISHLTKDTRPSIVNL